MKKIEKVMINGKFYTVSGDNWDKEPREALAVDKDGMIAFVGSSEDAMKLCADAEVIDLKGKTVLPGFIDGHVHVPGAALMELYEINLNGISSKEETLSVIADYIEKNPDMDSYFGSGFNMGMVDSEGNPPCAEWLDQICSDRPLVMRSYDMHSRWVNTKAMEMCGVTKETKAADIGHIHKDRQGNPTGLFTDVRNIQFVEPTYNDKQQTAALKKFMQKMNGWGYTSIMGIPPTRYIDQKKYNQLEDEGELTLRINCGEMVDKANTEEDVQRLVELKKCVDSDMVRVTTAKFLIDGVIEGKTAFLKEPYVQEDAADADYYGKVNWSLEALKKAVLMANENGFQVHMHSIGDAATNNSLDAIEYAQKTTGKDTFRNVITHLQLVEEKDKKRFGDLKVIAAIQPFWHFKEPDWYETVDKAVLGEERAEKEYPARSLVDNGAIITASGDYPVSPANNPFFSIKAGVTRNVYDAEQYGVKIEDADDPTYLLNKEERLTLKEMIEAYTINGAYQLFREKEVGSLEIGKKADFIVIDDDLFDIDIMDVEKINVIVTVLDGKVVYGNFQEV